MALWRSTWQPALSGLRLWQRLAIVLLPLLVLVTALELWMTRHDAMEAANAAYDRSLVGGAQGHRRGHLHRIGRAHGRAALQHAGVL